MGDEFQLDDALGHSNASGQQSQSGQNWNNQWGGPGQPYQGGYPAPGPGQQYPNFPPGGQPYPGAPSGGQPYPGAPSGGQPYPGGPAGGHYYPGFPGFPGFPAPGQPFDPKAAGQSGPAPSAPPPSAPAGPLKLPYILPLQAGIMPGLVVTIQAAMNPNAKRWGIDFKRGGDIAFHFNPRCDENPNVMVRNSMLNGRWGPEERGASKFPFNKGQPFMLQIFVEKDQYRVAVNNENVCQYKHRNAEFPQIKEVHIGGDITLNGATVSMM